jgi:hypothetical protein
LLLFPEKALRFLSSMANLVSFTSLACTMSIHPPGATPLYRETLSRRRKTVSSQSVYLFPDSQWHTGVVRVTAWVTVIYVPARRQPDRIYLLSSLNLSHQRVETYLNPCQPAIAANSSNQTRPLFAFKSETTILYTLSSKCV